MERRAGPRGGERRQHRPSAHVLFVPVPFGAVPRQFFRIRRADSPIHYSPYNGKVLPGYMYTDTGFWDTFRCLFPLLNLMYPEQNAKMQAGLVNAYKESGFLPEWASPGHRGMVGMQFGSIVADAYLKGLRG